MTKTTEWIHGRPQPDILDPDNWTGGVPNDGDTIVVPWSPGHKFPPHGCLNLDALASVDLAGVVCRAKPKEK